MKTQRIFIFYYIAVFLSFFYFKYISLLKNERNPINVKRINLLKGLETRPFEYKFYVYHDNYHLSKKVSIKLNQFISVNGFPSSLSHVESYGSDYQADDFTHTTLEEITSLDKPFIVVVNYSDIETGPNQDQAKNTVSILKDLDFNVTIKGGNTVIFTLLKKYIYTEQGCERMFALIKRIFVNSENTRLRSTLDVNFVLLSTEGRVYWDFKGMMNDYLNNLIACFSVFHDVNLHSRVVSNTDLYSKLSTTTSVVKVECDSTETAVDTDNGTSFSQITHESNVSDRNSNEGDTDDDNEGDDDTEDSGEDVTNDINDSKNDGTTDGLSEENNGNGSEGTNESDTKSELDPNEVSIDSENEGNTSDTNVGETNTSETNTSETATPDTANTVTTNSDDTNTTTNTSDKANPNLTVPSVTNDSANGGVDDDIKKSKPTKTKPQKTIKQVENVTVEFNTEFFNFFEGLGNVDVAIKDNHYYRNSLNFYLVLTDKPTFIKDPMTEESRQSFTIDNLGVFLFTTLEELRGGGNSVCSSDGNAGSASEEGAHVLNDSEITQVLSSWVPHVRHLYDLPATKSEMVLSLSNSDEKMRAELDDKYVLSSKSDIELKFGVQFQDPVGMAFYGFEVHKLAKSLVLAYVKASFENLAKVADLTKVSYNTQVPKSTVQHVNNSLDALEYLMGKRELDDTYLNQMDKNQRLILLAKHAFLESLEALSDDQMFNKNVLSYEHQLAVFMCDVFPFAFPVLVYMLKLLAERLKNK
ncbi:hypothetical protein MACJ_001736 [Theileria orientalis]|uniref:Uncharacterized protein n=1 Tax=Theileria orientalis TaxID=68886 RepID=A0A976M926_THEOR|nr:hypothetical protein MACJ_001736 [Theileria orientalis]